MVRKGPLLHNDLEYMVFLFSLQSTVPLSRGNITLEFKPVKVKGYLFSASCNWWSDLLKGRINLPVLQKRLAGNCLLGFLILLYAQCHVVERISGGSGSSEKMVDHTRRL